MAKIVIVGVGDDGFDGLSESSRAVIREADWILGTAPALAAIGAAAGDGRRVELYPDMTTALVQTRQALSEAARPVLVSQGDPLFYGIARFLCDRLGKERFEVIPHVSSMQLAFARLKESWEDAYLTSLAERPLEVVLERIRTAEKVGLFSSDRHPPAKVARALLDRGIDYFKASVCENLGSPDERITTAELADLVGLEFHPLNVMVLVRKPNRPDRRIPTRGMRLFGNPDEAFAQSLPKRELITQAEVRAIALALMDLRPESVVWDIGAGSGSVSIEAARLAPRGMVYAIEPEPTDLALIESNAEAFAVDNVRAIPGRAPEVLASLPTPDAIFVGGTGRQVESILREAWTRLAEGGRLVVNVATVDGLATAHTVLKQLAGGSVVEVRQVWIARGIDQLDRVRFEAANPTFVLSASKTGIIED